MRWRRGTPALPPTSRETDTEGSSAIMLSSDTRKNPGFSTMSSTVGCGQRPRFKSQLRGICCLVEFTMQIEGCECESFPDLAPRPQPPESCLSLPQAGSGFPERAWDAARV